jgi:CheY-like chemotaxis protein
MFKALIVENNTKLRQKIKAILELRLPFVAVNEASDTEETLKKIEIDPPNFVLMDIRLESENGLNLIKKIREKYPQIIITVNSYSDSFEYQFKIWSTPSNPFFILVKEDSELIKKIIVGDVIKMKYYSSVSDHPKELTTEIKSKTLDLYGGFKGHYIVGLKILHGQNGQ